MNLNFLMKQAVWRYIFKSYFENSLEEIQRKAFVLSMENPGEIHFMVDLWFLYSTIFLLRDVILAPMFILIIGFEFHARSCV